METNRSIDCDEMFVSVIINDFKKNNYMCDFCDLIIIDMIILI